MFNLETLKNLCLLNAPSGFEDEVRNFIIKETAPFAQSVKTDTTGNIIVFKKGEKRRSKKFAVCANMDEAGLIVTNITNEGYLRFKTLGEISPSELACRNVIIGENKLRGIIGTKPIHILKAEEKNTAVSSDDLCIDIGAKDKEQAEKFVNYGDFVYFEADFSEHDGRILSKALSSRLGCAALIETIKTPLTYDTYFIFTVQSRLNSRGAITSAFSVNPDIALVTGAVDANDTLDTSSAKRKCSIGNGAVIPFMDKNTVYDRNYFNFIVNLARNNSIQYQITSNNMAGSDAENFRLSRNGIKTACIAVACRYTNNILMAADLLDFESALKLINEAIKSDGEV